MTQTNETVMTEETVMVEVSELPQALVNDAIMAGVERAKWYMYPIDKFWTTTVKLSNYEFEVHKELNKEPTILHCRKLS